MNETTEYICECGECELEITDCCDVRRPSCEVTTHLDPNGDPLVTQCHRGFGCRKGEL